MPDWDLLLEDLQLATMVDGAEPYGIVHDGAIAIEGGNIVWVGAAADLPATDRINARSLGGRWVTPALIDCHTHLVFAGNRAAEFEQRLEGMSYEEISRSGGGIMSTVDATRAASGIELQRET
jgi:imidazolonepropionase